MERFENNLLFWKKRNEEEIKTFFEEFRRILKEKEQACLENNENQFAQNIFHLKSCKINYESYLNYFAEYNKIINHLLTTNKKENLGEFLINIKSQYQAKNKIESIGETVLEEPNYDNYLFDKENEIKKIIAKLKESYGNILNPIHLMKEKYNNADNMNNTICYFNNISEEKRY